MQNTSSLLYGCAVCKNKFPFGSVKYTPNGKSLVCLGCYDQTVKQAAAQPKKPGFITHKAPVANRMEPRQVAPSRVQDAKKAVDPADKILQTAHTGEYQKYRCPDCKYKFSLKTTSRIKRACPYCGKANIVSDEMSSETILNDASKSIYE